jgi:hypothetical protein
MTLPAARAEIAEILSTVDDVTGSAYRPSVLRQGSAWPLIGEIVRDEETPGFMVTWRIVVILPGDEIPAAKWFDSHLDDIVETIDNSAWGYVSGVTPGLWESSGGPYPAMFITIRREV